MSVGGRPREIVNIDEHAYARKQYYERTKEERLLKQKEYYYLNKDRLKPKYIKKGRNMNPHYDRPFKSSGFILKETEDGIKLPRGKK